LKPHQKLSIISSQSSHGNYQLSVNNVDVTPYIAWNTGKFAFSDVPLDIILSIMRNWYHIDIELANSDAGKLLFTGTIDRYGSPNTILKSISKVTGLTIIQSGNHYTIK
jgi:ferric-dicitrate binding protein FerR (iron transport regulator)